MEVGGQLMDVKMDIARSAAERVDSAYRCLREAIALAELAGMENAVVELRKQADNLRFSPRTPTCAMRGLV